MICMKTSAQVLKEAKVKFNAWPAWKKKIAKEWHESLKTNNGDVAQLVEHFACTEDVAGSNPVVSTISRNVDFFGSNLLA